MRIICTLFTIVLITSIGHAQHQMVPQGSELHKVTVKKALQTNAYTYLLVRENDTERWLAAPKMNPVINAVYYYLGELEMKNFESKELARTFDSVTFVEGLLFEEIYLDGKFPLKGGTTIADLFINKDEYEGKVVKVRGRVTKFNEKIMDKNWIHLDDGTNILGNRDFVATTTDVVRVGDVITLTGKISKHVDLGSGYLFEVLMEDGKIIDK